MTIMPLIWAGIAAIGAGYHRYDVAVYCGLVAIIVAIQQTMNGRG